MKYIIGMVFLIILWTSCRGKSEIPVFNLLLLDSTSIINTADIPQGKVTVIVLFYPECEYCQEETIDLIKHRDAVKEIQFYYVSMDSLHRIKSFSIFYGLNTWTNVVFGRDFTGSFPRLSGLHKIPSSLVYDKQGRLRARIVGGFDANEIIGIVKKM